MLLPVSEVRQRLLDALSPTGITRVSTTEAYGSVLGEDVLAQYDAPSFSNSAMDGFAVYAADVAVATKDTPVILEVAGDIPAGSVQKTSLKAGQAHRIMTGAPMPDGADTVVPVEETDFNYRDLEAQLPENVAIFSPSVSGQYVRPRGEDFKQGEPLLKKGQRIRPQDIGMLAMMGMSAVAVYEKPRVVVMSTGDELLPIDADLTPGKIRDTNTYTLSALIEAAGGEIVRLGIVPDRFEIVKQRLDEAAESDVNLIVSSAGVSVGAFDFVRAVVEEYGELNFWRVNMRPGKPLAFGSYRGIPFMGLPGNPVSAFAGFEVFLRPALYKLAGQVNWERPVMQATLREDVESDGRETYLRAQINQENNRMFARLTGHQGSGNLYSLVRANGLIVIPAGVKRISAGEQVTVWLLDR
ncbi:MAG: molybdopterin molybdotransferase MoeA [Anaerolineales bacterium]|nr:molybdopterin molybdotransferase MoeA [Anaerolineales bacterium]